MITVRCQDRARLAELIAIASKTLSGQRLATIYIRPVEISKNLWGFKVPRTIEDEIEAIAAAMGLSAVVD